MLALRTARNPDLAIDLGTGLARVGISRAPTFVARPTRIGQSAAIENGAVVNVDAAAEILRQLFRRFQRLGCWGSRALACAPSDATDEERNALERAVTQAGASKVYIAPEPLAAAIGAGLNVASEDAMLVIDMGEGVTDCAVIAEGRILASRAVRGGCGALRREIIDAIENESGLLLSEDEAERLLRYVGIPSATEGISSNVMTLAIAPGTAVARRHPVRAEIVTRAILRIANEALDAADQFVRSLDTRYGAEVVDSGIVLTGGGALVPGMAARFSDRLKIPVSVASTPLESVIHGARQMLSVAGAAHVWD